MSLAKAAAPGVRVIMVRADPRLARNIHGYPLSGAHASLFLPPCGGSLWVLSKKPIKTNRENFSRSAKAARSERKGAPVAASKDHPLTAVTRLQGQEEEEVQ